MVKKVKFDSLMMLISFLFSLVMSLIFAGIYINFNLSPNGKILWTALFLSIPMLSGLCGICIVEHKRQKEYIFKEKKNRIVSLVIILLFCTSIGAGGQYLYMLTGKDEVKKETIEEIVPSDMVIMLDYSGSMSGCLQTCRDAGCMLINSLSDENFVQVGFFDDRVREITELKKMTTSGKQEIKDFIVNTLATGGNTSFEDALETAVTNLKTSESGNENKVIILINDCYGSVAENTVRFVLDSGFPVYSVSMKDDTMIIPQDPDLPVLCKKSGGFDMPITKDSNGNISLTELLGALEKTNTKTKEIEIITPKDQMSVFGNEYMSVIRFIIRLLMLILYGILSSLAYFVALKKSDFVLNIAIGLAATIILTFIGENLAYLSAIIYSLIYQTAYTTYRYDFD